MASNSMKVGADEIGMSERIRVFDWAATPLGPMENWPDALKMSLSIAEHSAFPTAIYWGRDLRLIYNDAWAPIPADRHPWALGRPGSEVWADIWSIVGPQLEGVLNSGRGFSAYEQMLPMVRDGVQQETYWNYSFTPIRDAAGAVVGVFNQGNEVTRTVMTERRLSFQIALSDRLRGLAEPEEVKMAAAEMLGRHLRVARAGYGQIDDAQERVSVRGDWTKDESIPSLAGESRILDAFGEEVVAILRAGDTVLVNDHRADPRVNQPHHAATWESIATRALIVVPLVKSGKLTALLYLHEPEPRSWQSHEAALAREVAERTWSEVQRAETEERHRESEDHYRHTVEFNPQVTWTALPDGQLNRVSRRWFDWTGTTGTGESWAAGLHPDDVEASFAAWGHSVSTGEPYDTEHRVKMLGGEFRWARSRAFPRRTSSGDICLWYGSTEDIHEQKLAEERQRLLINELNHRVKNSLATVQAIAFQTLKGDISVDEARVRFEARLLALSQAHNLLTEEHWEGAPLERVVADTTAYLASDGKRYEAEGPPIFVGPRAALALSLALHELSTNALKYGALSGEDGKVSISWTVDDAMLRLRWKESGGPAVKQPERRGFGSRLIERGLAADLGGRAELCFEPDGLCCIIEASREAIEGREAAFV